MGGFVDYQTSWQTASYLLFSYCCVCSFKGCKVHIQSTPTADGQEMYVSFIVGIVHLFYHSFHILMSLFVLNHPPKMLFCYLRTVYSVSPEKTIVQAINKAIKAFRC